MKMLGLNWSIISRFYCSLKLKRWINSRDIHVLTPSVRDYYCHRRRHRDAVFSIRANKTYSCQKYDCDKSVFFEKNHLYSIAFPLSSRIPYHSKFDVLASRPLCGSCGLQSRPRKRTLWSSSRRYKSRSERFAQSATINQIFYDFRITWLQIEKKPGGGLLVISQVGGKTGYSTDEAESILIGCIRFCEALFWMP